KQAALLRHSEFGVLAVAGTGGGLTRDLVPGDLVVGTEISDGTSTTQCASAALLAGELRRAGLRARAGRVVTVDHLVRGSERERLAAGGALVADLESAPLAAAAGNRPVAVLRAVSDNPQRPLLHPGGLAGGRCTARGRRGGAPPPPPPAGRRPQADRPQPPCRRGPGAARSDLRGGAER